MEQISLRLSTQSFTDILASAVKYVTGTSGWLVGLGIETGNSYKLNSVELQKETLRLELVSPPTHLTYFFCSEPLPVVSTDDDSDREAEILTVVGSLSKRTWVILSSSALTDHWIVAGCQSGQQA